MSGAQRQEQTMQRVYSSPSPAEAHLVQGYLEQAGLKAIVQGGELGGLLGLTATTETYASVWVPDEELAQAEELVEAFLSDDQGENEPEAEGAFWRCASCGEELEPQFTDCWNCGATRVASQEA
jgi:hypothetical protein